MNLAVKSTGKIALKSIKSEIVFTEIFKRSKKISVENAYCYIVFDGNRLSESHTIFNYAAVVRKKVVHKAVCRNRVKRLLREALREVSIENFEAEFFKSIKYFILYWNEPLDRPTLLRLDTVKSALDEIFSLAEEFYTTKYTKFYKSTEEKQ